MVKQVKSLKAEQHLEHAKNISAREAAFKKLPLYKMPRLKKQEPVNNIGTTSTALNKKLQLF